MRLDIEVWLRGNDFASTEIVDVPVPEPAAWADDDVRRVLEALLRAIARARDPHVAPDCPVTLRGFNWIVSPFENRGVLISVEIQLGAAAAGPFALEEQALGATITRVLAHARTEHDPGARRVH